MSPLGMEALSHRVKLHGVVETVTPLHIGLVPCQTSKLG